MVHARLAAGAVRWSGLQVSRRLTHSYARSAALNIHASHDCARLFRPNVPAQKWAGGVRYSSTTASSKSTSLVKLSTPQGLEQCQTFGFCFDIDGVLYQGSNKVAATLPTLKFLTDHGVGLVLLTNGGGKVVEDERARRLEAKLGVPEGRDILRGRVIQSHTPSRGWPEQVKNQTVFITGSDPEAARKIAKSYGFTNVVTSHDLLRGNPALYPFDHKLGNAEGEDKPEPRGAVLPKRIWNADPFDHDGARRSDALRIDKVLIWNDPRDWSVDIQLIYDMLISHRGYLGTVSGRNGDGSLPNGGWQQDGQPEVWMSNLDLFWKTEYGVNRYGTGAFLEALKGVWAASTGGAPLRFRAMGKPFKESYDYAERLLLSQTTASTDTAESEGETTTPMKRVYMIGDNPESDIRGASEYQSSKGVEWVPILVRTGVWQETEGRKTPPYSPAAVVDDVLDAVVWAMRNEGLDVDRALVSRLYREHGWEKGA